MYCSYRAKPLNKLSAGLNHPVELVAILKAKLVFAHVTYCELMNNN